MTAPPIPVASAAPTALALAGTTDGDTGAGGAAGDAGASGLGGQVGGSGERGGAHGAGGSGGDLRAACIECPAPEYPRQAERQGWEGSVDLRLRIHTDGRVAEVAVVRPSGFDVLDAAAVAAARRSRFRLAVELQRAGDVWGRMRYRFELDG